MGSQDVLPLYLIALPMWGRLVWQWLCRLFFLRSGLTIRESSSWRVGESFGKHIKSAPLGRGALFVCCGIADDLIMISSAFPVDYFPVLLSALPVDVPKEE